MKAFHELRNIGVIVHGAFNYLETFRSKLFLNATQDLSGVSTVRSSGEDKCQDDYFALVIGWANSVAIGQGDRDFSGWAGKSRGDRGEAGDYK
jgi:hypothetical protein